jgi:hypothetical protein
MDALQFCYWLQGYFEITYIPDLTREQVEVIKDHLELVFNKVTPNRTIPFTPYTCETLQSVIVPSTINYGVIANPDDKIINMGGDLLQYTANVSC